MIHFLFNKSDSGEKLFLENFWNRLALIHLVRVQLNFSLMLQGNIFFLTNFKERTSPDTQFNVAITLETGAI